MYKLILHETIIAAKAILSVYKLILKIQTRADRHFRMVRFWLEDSVDYYQVESEKWRKFWQKLYSQKLASDHWFTSILAQPFCNPPGWAGGHQCPTLQGIFFSGNLWSAPMSEVSENKGARLTIGFLKNQLVISCFRRSTFSINKERWQILSLVKKWEMMWSTKAMSTGQEKIWAPNRNWTSDLPYTGQML